MSTFHTHTGNIAQHQHPQWPPLFIPYNVLSSLQAYTFKKRDIFLGLYNIHKIENPAGGLGFSALIFLPLFSFFSGADYQIVCILFIFLDFMERDEGVRHQMAESNQMAQQQDGSSSNDYSQHNDATFIRNSVSPSACQ